MKSRCCFVSNSSSSSFILAEKQPCKCEYCGRSDMRLMDIIGSRQNRWGATELFEVESTSQEDFTSHFSWYDENEMAKAKDVINKYMSEGRTIIAGSVSDHDELILDAINRGVSSGHIIKIL